LSHRRLHPLPTRRSSDLGGVLQLAGLLIEDRLTLRIELRSVAGLGAHLGHHLVAAAVVVADGGEPARGAVSVLVATPGGDPRGQDRKSTRLNSSHVKISY